MSYSMDFQFLIYFQSWNESSINFFFFFFFIVYLHRSTKTCNKRRGSKTDHIKYAIYLQFYTFSVSFLQKKKRKSVKTQKAKVDSGSNNYRPYGETVPNKYPLLHYILLYFNNDGWHSVLCLRVMVTMILGFFNYYFLFLQIYFLINSSTQSG